VVARLNLTVKSTSQPHAGAEEAAAPSENAESAAEQGFRSKAKARHSK